VKEHFSGDEFLIPATLVFVPYRDPLGSAVLGQSSNGLSGGNSLEEALLHAVLEVVERDTLSFASVSGLERRVVKIDDPRWLELEDKIQAAGLRIYVTYCQNIFQLPMFICYLFDPAFWSGVCVARGQGTHLNKAISLLRAVTEAIQSRLTNIHGGRDDIISRFTTYQRLGAQREVHEFTQLEADLVKCRTIEYGDIHTDYAPGDDLKVALSFLLENIYKLGFEYLFYYDLTKHMTNYWVLKVIIPSLEFYSPTRPRIGKRLLSHVAGSW
jgi:ribosomal protein S12 methylthiotransferase accessory factor